MRIEHIALWTKNLEQLKEFYIEFFGGKANEKYHNSKTEFESYFLTFDSGARLEIMRAPSLNSKVNEDAPFTGYVHMAFSTGSKEGVDTLTDKIRERGYKVISGPRQTGDGYYESCILDPDGNVVEITI
ncbi:MAG: VOC family protein [Clostridia bacterium]|nr:VOC family protein [Clostridia bacterium]